MAAHCERPVQILDSELVGTHHDSKSRSRHASNANHIGVRFMDDLDGTEVDEISQTAR